MRTRVRFFSSAVLVLGALAVSPAARAQSTGFAVNRFEPSDRGSDWFSLDSLDMRGRVRPALGLVGEWAYRPLVITNGDGSVRHSIVRDQAVLHIGAGLVLWDRLRLGVNVPIQVYADGHQGTLNGVTYPPPSSATSLSDVRVGTDLRLFGEYGDAITGAIGARLWIPTGDSGSYAGDTSVRVEPRALVAGDAGIFAYAAEVGVMYRAQGGEIAGTAIGTELHFGGSAGLRLAEKKLLVGPEVFGSTVVSSGGTASNSTPVEGLLGAHYTLLSDWKLDAGVSTGLTGGVGTPVFRGLLGFTWFPAYKKAEPPSDRDNDGILDGDDACVDVPGVKTDDPKTNGCPPPGDRDKDGILDKDDACADVPGVKTDDPLTNGCPPDRDKDGIVDADDACIDVPGIKTDDPKTNGCPADRDKDGVLDKDDACIDVPGLKTSDPKTNGCPDPDRDKDGIPNAQDACPDEPGKPDPDPKRNGCPKAFVQSGQIKILDQVKFKTNSAEILPGKDSEEVLQAVLGVLNGHTEIKGLRIEGHTDNRGSAALNKKLSAARAASVMKWLVKHGVDSSRLTSAGFGPDKPLDTNDTEEGRRNNRRVEFHIEGGGEIRE